MLHHYMTKYTENGKRYAESWLQINIFGKCFCFSRRKRFGEDTGVGYVKYFMPETG